MKNNIWIDNSNGVSDYNETYERQEPFIETKIQDLSFDKKTNVLQFKIVKVTRTHKIARYKTVNYERFPIYKGYSYRSKQLLKFSKCINPEIFLNQQILKITQLEHQLKLKIIDEIGFVPDWRKTEIVISKIEKEISSERKKLRFFDSEKIIASFNEFFLPEKAGNFWLRFIFAFFTFGLSFIGYISKAQAQENKLSNDALREKQIIKRKNIDEKNVLLKNEIKQHNLNINEKINKLKNKINEEKQIVIEKNITNENKIIEKEFNKYNISAKPQFNKLKNMINEKEINTNMKRYDLNIKDILEEWKISDAIREIIANAIDEQKLQNSKEILIYKKENQWSIRDYGRGISTANFSLTENKEKIDKEGMIGKFGIGLKDAIAVLFKNNIKFKIKTPEFIAFPKLEPKEGFGNETIHMIIDDSKENDLIDKGTEFVFENLSDDDMFKAKNNFLIFNRQEIIAKNEYGQALDSPFASFIYVNGMKIAECEKYLFSYNIIKPNKKLSEKMTRERKSIGQEAYSQLIENILKGNLTKEMCDKLFSNADYGEMQKKSIREEVYKEINKQDKTIFITKEQISNMSADQLEKYKSGGKEFTIIENKDADLSQGLYNVDSAIEEYSKSFDFEFVNENNLDMQQEIFFNKISKILEKLNKYFNKSMKLKIVKKNNPWHEDTLGYWTNETPETIFIVLIALNKWQSAITTVLHEFAHSMHGYGDNTRDFERDLQVVWFIYSELKIINKLI